MTADADAIVHMAAYPSPGPVTEDIVFRTNVMNNWNILEAAEMHGIKKIVMASSINALVCWFRTLPSPTRFFCIPTRHVLVANRARPLGTISPWITSRWTRTTAPARRMRTRSPSGLGSRWATHSHAAGPVPSRLHRSASTCSSDRRSSVSTPGKFQLNFFLLSTEIPYYSSY